MTVLAPLPDCAPDARLASPALPELARDGYLIGVIMAPQPAPVLRWLAPLLAGDDLLLADNWRFRAERDAILAQYTAMATAIDRHLARLVAERICDYRPAFWPGDTKPAHSTIRRWACGFATAMALVPDAWSALLEDELTAMLVAPFVGFFGIDDPSFEPADDFAQRLDEATAFMPRAILVLRKLARMRACRAPEDAQMPPGKTGRNDPCPCGSGRKYKRCCGTGPH
jgi:uncharacterized protein